MSLTPSPVPRPVPWCSHEQLIQQIPCWESQSSRERLRMDAATKGAVSATRLELPLLLVALQSSQVCWPFPFNLSVTWYETCALGKKEPERLFSNRCLDSQGVFQHGSQRPLQVHWEWEVQILSRTLARKLPLSVCLAASKWEGTALRFQILSNTHSCKWEPL